MSSNRLGKTGVLVFLPKRTLTYLDTEVDKVRKRYGIKSGRSTLLQAVAAALELAHVDLLSPSPGQLTEKLFLPFLCATSKLPEVKSE